MLLSKNVYTASKLPAHCGDRSLKSQVSLFLGVIICQVYFFYYLYKATVSHTRVTKYFNCSLISLYQSLSVENGQIVGCILFY